MNPLSAVARLVVAVAASLAIVAPAEAGRRSVAVQHVQGCRCHACLQKQVVVQQVIQQPAYNHVPYAAATYNFVGAPIRLQAEQAYTMKSHPQWAQFQQYLAQQTAQGMAQQMFQQYVAQHQQQQQQQQQQQAAPQPIPQAGGVFGTMDASGKWTPAPGYDGPTPMPPNPIDATTGQPLFPGTPPATPEPPAQAGVPNLATPSLTPFAAKIPLLVEYCARCHSQEKPGGGFAFDGSVDLTIKGEGPAAEEMAKKRDHVLQAIVSQRMPKDGALEPAVAGAIVAELYQAD